MMNALWFALTLVTTVHASHLPKNWKGCKMSDPNRNACLKESITIALSDLMDGNPSLAVKPLDPLSVNKLILNPEGPGVDFKMVLSSVQVTGFKKFVVDEIETDWKTLKVRVRTPSDIRVVGHYKLSGKFLLLPMTGEGPVDISAEQLWADFTMKFSEKRVNGVAYNHVDESGLKMDLKGLQVNFENLFNGEKTLGYSMNKAMNTNWPALWVIIKAPLEKEYNRIFMDVATAVFSNVPKNELTLN